MLALINVFRLIAARAWSRHCRDCGNPDCPKVSGDPYWQGCPAEVK